MAAVTKNRNFFSCQFQLYYKSKWTQKSYMAIFSASLFHLGILWDKNHIKIFRSEIWVEMIFGWSTFKIICNTPIFYQLDVKLKTRWAITGSWEPLVFYIVYKPTIDLPVVYCYFQWLQAIQWLNSLHLLLMLVFYLVLLCVFMFCVVVSVTISE